MTLIAEYDFSDATTLWQDTARTTQVATSGDIIKGVTDKSGSGHHLSEATNGPAYTTGVKNGLSVARFDGINDQLAGSMSADSSYTVFLVVQKRSAPDGNSRTIFCADPTSCQLHTNSGTDASAYLWYKNEGGGTSVLGGTASDWNILVLRVNSATSMDFYPSSLQAGTNINPNDIVVSGTTYGYGSNTASNFSDVDYAHVKIFDSAMSAAEIDSEASALATKWSISWTGPPNTPQSVNVGATLTADITTQKTKQQSIDVGASVSAALATNRAVGQAVSVAASLTAALSESSVLGRTIAVSSSVTAAISTVAQVAAHLMIDTILPSFRQRMHLNGAGTGFVPPDFTIDLHSTPIIGATFAGLRASWTADGPGAMEIDLRPMDINDNWTPGADSIVLNWGGGPVFAGPIERLEQSGPPEDVRFTASALGWASRLDYRIVRHEFDIRDNVDVMVSALLDEAQTQFNGDMGFAMGTVSGTTANRLRNYCFGVNIGDAIRELAQVGHGFDWEVDANLKLNIWQNTRGVHTGKTLQDSDTSSWSVSADTADALTNVSSIGSQDQPFGPIHRLSYSPGLSTVYGRREVAIDVDSTDETELFDSGDAELSTRAGARMQVQTMWIDDRGPWPFGAVWLQDIVSVVLPTYFGGTQDMRCTEINLSLEPGTHYYVEHTFEALCVDITQAQDDGA